MGADRAEGLRRRQIPQSLDRRTLSAPPESPPRTPGIADSPAGRFEWSTMTPSAASVLPALGSLRCVQEWVSLTWIGLFRGQPAILLAVPMLSFPRWWMRGTNRSVHSRAALIRRNKGEYLHDCDPGYAMDKHARPVHPHAGWLRELEADGGLDATGHRALQARGRVF